MFTLAAAPTPSAPATLAGRAPATLLPRPVRSGLVTRVLRTGARKPADISPGRGRSKASASRCWSQRKPPCLDRRPSRTRDSLRLCSHRRRKREPPVASARARPSAAPSPASRARDCGGARVFERVTAQSRLPPLHLRLIRRGASSVFPHPSPLPKK